MQTIYVFRQNSQRKLSCRSKPNWSEKFPDFQNLSIFFDFRIFFNLKQILSIKSELKTFGAILSIAQNKVPLHKFTFVLEPFLRKIVSSLIENAQNKHFFYHRIHLENVFLDYSYRLVDAGGVNGFCRSSQERWELIQNICLPNSYFW